MKKTFYILLGIFILAEFLFLVFPRIFNFNTHKDFVYSLTEKFINTGFEYDEIYIKTYPDFSLEINAKNPKLENIVQAENLELNVGLLKAVFGKISVKKLLLKNPDLKIIVYKNGTTNLDKILQPMPFSLNLGNLKYDIENYKLFLEDEKTGQKININGDYIKGGADKNDIDISVKGNIIAQNENADIDLNIQAPLPDIKSGFKNKNKYLIVTGHIKNLHPEIFEDFIKSYISKDLEDIQGVINADFKPKYENNVLKTIDVNIGIDDLKIISSKKENSVIFEGKNNLNAKINIDKNNFKLNELVISGKNYKIVAKGIIEKFKTKNPDINIDINIDNSNVESFYWKLPSTLFTSNEEIRKIKKYGAYGVANGNLKLKGNIYKPEVYGQIDFNDVWILDGLPHNVPKAIVKTEFKKDIVAVDVKVWATEKEYVTVVGYSDFFDLSNNEYQINSTQNVPLAVAQKMLPPVSDVLGFIIGPVPIMDIKGLGNIDLNAKGSQKNPELNGYFVFKDASASFNDIKGLKLENANGKIDFKKDKVYFKNDNGTILGSPAKISGVSDIKVDIDYEAKVDNVSLGALLTTLKTSPMLKEYAYQTKLIDNIDGNGDIYINLKGHMDDPKAINEPDVIKYITPKGYINIKNANIITYKPKTVLSNTIGTVKFDNDDVDLDINSNLYTSPLNVIGKIKDNKAVLNITSKKIKLTDAAKFLIGFYTDKIKNINDISNTTTFSMNMKYKGSAEDLDLNGVDLTANFGSKNNSAFKIDVLSGMITLKDGDLKISNLNSKFYNTTAFVNGKADNIFKKPLINMNLSLFKFDLSTLNYIKNSSFLPNKYKRILNAYKDYKGIISTKLNINNNNINGNIWLRDISFSHKILEYPFSVTSSDFIFKDNNLKINNFNASFAGTPVFINGEIENIIRNPKYNINFSSKLSKAFVDNYINTNISYPVNIKGEILLSAQIKGTKDEISIIPSMKLEEDADLSYMGANLGEENSIREIKGEIYKNKDKLIIKNMDYSKYINSQNNRLYPLPMVNIKASVAKIKNKPYIEYLNLKTHNPIEANIFNALIKKSLIKNGQVMCDLKIEGFIDNPKIQGNASLKNIDIPVYETHVENVKIDFGKYINLNAQIDYLDSDMAINAKIRNNNFKTIYFDNIEIFSKTTNLNKLLMALNELSYKNPIQLAGKDLIQNDSFEQYSVDLSNIVIEKGIIKTDKILYKTLPISNFSSKISFKNNNFKLEDTNLDLADGKLTGNFGYNLEKALISVNTNTKGVDANKITEALLDIKNQIYGKLDGSINITTYGADDFERMKNLNGTLSFSVNNGKMPKLGSIEYLLRAGNLVKSGISGLTLNNISGLLLPVQHGDFDAIKGDISIKKGIIDDMKIYSKGKNLSILITGKYELESSKADIYILGKLSKNINTILGPVGNASLNSFFNLIPGIHLDETKDTEVIKQINSIPELSLPTDKFRIFRAKVDGDISSESFVSTFEWVNK